MHRARGCRIAVAALLAVLVGGVWTTAAGAQKTDKLDPRTSGFLTALDTGGFAVREGTIKVTDILWAVNSYFLDTAAGANAGQYYKRWVVPVIPGQVDTPEMIFRLAADEAVVYVGKTPPQCDYFSYCAFLWSRQFPDSYLPTGDWIFASVGDPLNNAGIQTEGQGNPFGKTTMVVLTADKGVYERVKAAAVAAGFPASMVNPLVLPSNMLRMGLDASADTFLVLGRTANIVSGAQEARYLADSQWARLYRVTPRVAPAPEPFAQAPWRERAYRSEEELVPGVEAALERLKAAIIAKTPHVQVRPLESVRWIPDSKDVLDPTSPLYRTYVYGDSSDSPYRRTAEGGVRANFVLGDDDTVVVYGVNHAATGIATYSSFGTYGEWYLNHLPLQPGDPAFVYGAGDPIWNGVASMTNHGFAGSAQEYLPHDPMARYLYAVRVVRKARAIGRDPYRVVVPEGGSTAAPFYPDVIPLDKPMMIGYRAYLNPATGAGPAYEDVIPDRAIWFKVR